MYQVIKMFSYKFQIKTMKYIKEWPRKKYVSVISLVMFHNNRKAVMYKVIGYDIYLFIDNYICLDYLCILHKNLSAYDNKFEKQSSLICLGWALLKLC